MKKIISFKRKLIFNIFIMITLILLLVLNTFASTDQSEIDVREKMISDLYYNDLIVNIIDSRVKMTQDDNYYYFDISQDLINNNYLNDRYDLNVKPTFIVSNMNEVVSLRVYVEEFIHTSDRTEKVWSSIYSGSSRDIVSHYNIDYKSVVRKNINNVNYYIADSNLVYNNTNANKISLSMSGSGASGTQFTLSTKFSIKKDSISGLRYFSFLFNKLYSKLASNNTYTGSILCGVTNYTIDLMQYIDCNHQYELKDYDDEKHTIYCKKCEWLRTDYHDYNICYDNIENDECICGLRKHIRLTHKNNLNDLVIERLATPNETIKNQDDFIKGHTLLYYEDLELINNDWTLATKSIINKLPDIAPTNSHIYTAIYKVNSYYIKYSSENNLNLKFDNKMDDIKLDYGEKYVLSKNVFNRLGYNFLGWSIRPDLTKKVFDDEEEVKSVSDVDGDIITLHPIFSAYQYNIHYIDERYGKDYHKAYTYDNFTDLDINTNLKTLDTFEGFKYNGKILHINNTRDLQQYVSKDKDTITLYSQYITDTNKHDIITEDKDIKIKTETIADKNQNINNLPIVVAEAFTNTKNRFNNLDKKHNLDNDFKHINFDDGFVDVFLTGNIRLLNDSKGIVSSVNQSWMEKINKIIIYIKNILIKNRLLSNILTIIIAFCVCMIFSLLLLLIIYLLTKIYENMNKKANKLKYYTK